MAAAIAALFAPVPAFADPAGAAQGLPPAVPDTGSRPTALGALVMPGQQAASPGAPTPTPTLPGSATSPALRQIEKGRAEIATLGDQLIQLGQDRDLAKSQYTVAEQKYAKAEENLRQAQAVAADAAAAAVREAAAMPPGSLDSGLLGLDDLARIQRGDGDSQRAAARQLELAQLDTQLALDEQTLTDRRYDELVAKYDKLNAQLTKKQAAQQTLELANKDELNAAEAAQRAADSTLGKQYLAGAEAGRGADPRALTALAFALKQIGKPYQWSEEGPDTYDCSGLMFKAYRLTGFPLMRVSRDQYWQTRNKVVDRYSLLPGDLLFFSYSNSWRGIHHVAMYAGNGMMVEAPRTGLDVRLTPVRWSLLFQATRVYGSVQGTTEGPDLSGIEPDDTNTAGNTTHTTKPRPSTPSKTTKPGTAPTKSTHPSTPPSSHSTPPTTQPPPSSPSPSASSTSPSGGGSSSSSSPSGGSSSSSPSGGSSHSSPSGGSSSDSSPSGGSSSDSSPSGGSSSSATATESATKTASATATKTTSATTTSPSKSKSSSSTAESSESASSSASSSDGK
nr:NlpC/P60 family protein [uncultured Actinoplanes sp.]